MYLERAHPAFLTTYSSLPTLISFNRLERFPNDMTALKLTKSLLFKTQYEPVKFKCLNFPIDMSTLLNKEISRNNVYLCYMTYNLFIL